jgi:hypothetical protein
MCRAAARAVTKWVRTRASRPSVKSAGAMTAIIANVTCGEMLD